jgi:hypothetical protein
VTPSSFTPISPNLAKTSSGKTLYEEAIKNLVDTSKNISQKDNTATRRNVEYLYQNHTRILDKVDYKVIKTKSAYYQNLGKGLIQTPTLDGKTGIDKEKAILTYLHETGHAFDYLMARKVLGPNPLNITISLSSFKTVFQERLKTFVKTKQERKEYEDEVLQPYVESLEPKQREILELTEQFEEAVELASKRQDLRETKSFEFVKEVQDEIGKYKEIIRSREKPYEEKMKAQEEITKLVKSQTDVGHVSDIFDALSSGRYFSNSIVSFGHGKKYYKSAGMKQAEIFSELGTLRLRRGDMYDALKEDFPEIVGSYEKIIEKVVDFDKEQ